MGRAANKTQADRDFAELTDKGLPRAEVRRRLDLSSGQYDGRKRRYLEFRRAKAC